MPSLIDEAVIDAEALKEAAIKNAESTVLEKYSSEIKNVVDTLLQEQEDSLLAPIPGEAAPPGGGADLGGATGGPPMPPLEGMGAPEDAGQLDETEEAPEAPPAEGLCPCPDIEQEIEGTMDHTAGSVPVDLTNVAASLDEDIEINFDELEKEILYEKESKIELSVLDSVIGEIIGEDASSESASDDDDGDDDDKDIPDSVSENIDISDDLVDKIVEQLTVDIDPQKSGWLETPIADIKLGVEQAETTEEDVEDDADVTNRLTGVLDALNEENEKLYNELSTLAKQDKEAKVLILKMKEKLQEVNLSNAKLLYTNRVLTSHSLNERQRNKIVESLSEAQNVDQAKVIFETLQSTVGVSRSKPRPESLSEVVNKNSSSVISGRDASPQEAPGALVFNRMRTLAGIK